MKRDMDQMIKTLMNKGYKINQRTIYAMRQVQRHKFCVGGAFAYEDTPLEIGYGQTISQPFMVAYMTQQLGIKPLDKVLEIGTGSGYQTAVLAELTTDVYSVERIFKLSQRTQKLLLKLGYEHVRFKVDDGHNGWEEHAPYDKIIVTAMADKIPYKLLKQLKDGGKMIVPYGGQIVEIIKKEEKAGVPIYKEKNLIGCTFVPLVKG